MRYLAVLMVVFLIGCDDLLDPGERGPYDVATLRILAEGTEAELLDLNENGHALWRENGQAILWDGGEIVEVPGSEFLGEDGEVLGASTLWSDGELTDLPGSVRGILTDGTIYLFRNDTMFTWRDGVLEATDRPVGHLVGPEGRIWANRDIPDAPFGYHEDECGFYLNGEWHQVVINTSCRAVLSEENGWTIGDAPWSGFGGQHVIYPEAIRILHDEGVPLDIIHVNSEGHAIALLGIIRTSGGERLDLREHLTGIRLGAINDDGEILAQLADRVVLLTPR